MFRFKSIFAALSKKTRIEFSTYISDLYTLDKLTISSLLSVACCYAVLMTESASQN